VSWELPVAIAAGSSVSGALSRVYPRKKISKIFLNKDLLEGRTVKSWI
jgi:hypothetical protein